MADENTGGAVEANAEVEQEEPELELETDSDADAGSDAGTNSDTDAAGSSQEKGFDEKFCESCGEAIKKEAEICPNCGVGQGSGGDSAGIAALLSAVGFFFPIAAGAGQIYNGDTGKGVAFSVGQCIHFVVVIFLFWTIIPLLTYPAVAGWAVYDAYKGAQ